MLTRLSAITSISALTLLSVAALTPSAYAGPCHSTGTGAACGIGGHQHSGGGTTTGHSGGGKGQTTAPPCPVGPTMNCGAINNPVPVAHIPTIDLAYEARNALVTPAPTVHTAPSPRTYVQLKTALWVDPADYAVLHSATPPADGQVVTLTATPQSITWNMGEGSVVCHSAGDRHGRSCGYAYQRSSADRPGGAYTISATVTWGLAWVCAGPCDAHRGTLAPATMTSNAQLAVGEVQTQSRPG